MIGDCMIRSWKRKGDPSGRPDLFCKKCGRCMYTKDDVRSRADRGICSRCSENSAVFEQSDVITIVIGAGV
jgi:hypothetical protein